MYLTIVSYNDNYMSKNLSKIAKAKKIKYFLISFVDLFGVLEIKISSNTSYWRDAKKWSWFCWVCNLA